MVKEIKEHGSITVTLDSELVDKIIAFKSFNRQTYLDFNKLSSLAFGIEEKLHEILHDLRLLVETAKSELEGYFTVDEALMLFVCFLDERLGSSEWRKPGRDIKILLHQNRERLEDFYGGLIPLDTLQRVQQKVEGLTPSQCNALVSMTYDLKSMTQGNTLRFSTEDIGKCFRTHYTPTAEEWYEVQIH